MIPKNFSSQENGTSLVNGPQSPQGSNGPQSSQQSNGPQSPQGSSGPQSPHGSNGLQSPHRSGPVNGSTSIVNDSPITFNGTSHDDALSAANGTVSFSPSPAASRQISTLSARSTGNNQSLFQWIISWRFRIVLLVHFSILMSVVLKFNMTIALVCMIEKPSPNASQTSSVTSLLPNKSVTVDGQNPFKDGIDRKGNVSIIVQDAKGTRVAEFEWESSVQGLILSSFTFLAWVTPIFTYSMCRRFGAKTVMLAGMLTSGCLTMLMPLGARLSPYALITMRVIMGFALGVIMPAASEMFAWWAPEFEKVSLVSMAYSGVNVGNVIVGITSGYLCSVPADNGWPLIFYVHGTMAILWCVTWQLLSSVKPDNHRFISDEEKIFIIQTRTGMDSKQTKLSLPFRTIFTSLPVWGFLLVMLMHFVAANMVFTYLPMFLSDTLSFSIQEIGLISSIGYGIRFAGVFTFSSISNILYRKLRLTKTTVRKLIQCSGLYVSGATIVVISFLQEKVTVLGLLAMMMFSQSATLSSGSVVPLDIAPRYSGFLNGISLTLSSVVFIPAPIIVSWMTSEGTVEQWRSVFLMIAVIFAAGATLFLVLGSAQLQSWATGAKGIKPNGEQHQTPPSAISIINRRLVNLALGPPRSPAFKKRCSDFDLTDKYKYNFNDAAIVFRQNFHVDHDIADRNDNDVPVSY